MVTKTVYDDAGHKMTTIDPRGVSTVTEFDALGRVAKVTDGAGNVMQTTYGWDRPLDHSSSLA